MVRGRCLSMGFFTTGVGLERHRYTGKGGKHLGAVAHSMGRSGGSASSVRQHAGEGNVVPMAQRAAPKTTGAPGPARQDKEGEDKAGDDDTIAENRGARGGGLTRGKRDR
jgi:hypothetical protein